MARAQAASIKATNATGKILIIRISPVPTRAVTRIDIELIKGSEKWQANFGTWPGRWRRCH
jgi:hypothetical protein